MVWGIVVAIAVHLFAYFLYKVGKEVFAFGSSFTYSVWAFFLVYCVAAIGLKFLLPKPGPANIASIPRALMSTAYAAQRLYDKR